MAALTAGSVTYTLQEGTQSARSDAKFEATFKLVTATGQTYPTGGIPLTKAKLGCPNTITDLTIEDPGSGDGYVYKYNRTAEKIQIYVSAAVAESSHSHGLFVAGGAGAATTNVLQGVVATNSLARELAGNTTIAASNGTLGGVMTTTIAAVGAGQLTELANSVTTGALTLYARVIGW